MSFKLGRGLKQMFEEVMFQDMNLSLREKTSDQYIPFSQKYNSLEEGVQATLKCSGQLKEDYNFIKTSDDFYADKNHIDCDVAVVQHKKIKKNSFKKKNILENQSNIEIATNEQISNVDLQFIADAISQKLATDSKIIHNKHGEYILTCKIKDLSQLDRLLEIL